MVKIKKIMLNNIKFIHYAFNNKIYFNNIHFNNKISFKNIYIMDKRYIFSSPLVAIIPNNADDSTKMNYVYFRTLVSNTSYVSFKKIVGF